MSTAVASGWISARICVVFLVAMEERKRVIRSVGVVGWGWREWAEAGVVPVGCEGDGEDIVWVWLLEGR